MSKRREKCDRRRSGAPLVDPVEARRSGVVSSSLVCWIVLLLCFLFFVATWLFGRHNYTSGRREVVAVTCGSVIKLQHEITKYNLHSHTIKWGGGSQQQSVTSHGGKDDQGSLWIVKEADGAMPCEAGTPIACGTPIRLEHVATGKNLHSHSFRSPLSGGQEVSCFGDGGDGDSGDSWLLQCASKKEEKWTRGSSVKLKHVNTQSYLTTNTKYKFTQQNCPNCPIVGQNEVTGSSSAGAASSWTADQGVYLGAS